MNLLDIASTSGRQYKRVSSVKGGEYHGPCPGCGGTDRFHIWPGQGDCGSWWCRKCGKGGDAIQYLIDFEGMSFPDACKALGRELPEQQEGRTPRVRTPAPDSWRPRETAPPPDPWRTQAEKLVAWAHQRLLESPEQLAWCAARGLDLAAVKKYRLGWNPGEKGKDLYRAREAWGLDTVLKADGTAKKLWLPIGLVIPCYRDQGPGTEDRELHRVRIRRPEGDPRYYLVPGSGTGPMVLGTAARAYVVVESELDAILIHHLAGDIVGAVSQGNSTAKPDGAAHARLGEALAILVALDSDDAGAAAAVWWQRHYPQADRWPVPVGKDPGDAFRAGCDIRQWVAAGLPPALTLPSSRGPERSPPVPVEAPAAPPESVVHIIRAQDGRVVHITDDPAAYARLARDGAIVLDSREVAVVKRSGATPEDAARFLDVKEIFPGARIDDIGPAAPTPEPRKPGTCYWRSK
uniref:Alpha helicase n=1 Tax=Geobacter metallireducens TaxID=28232 RepID=A0A831UCI3_GEOME